MRTRIISAFPGVGKSYYHKLHPETTLDSDSSLFSWVEQDGVKVRNLNFPANYIAHIKANIGKYEFIFVSSHEEVRDALLDNCIFFYLMYPNDRDKDKYIQRYKDRGSPPQFIDLISTNWEKWLKELKFCEVGCKRVIVSMPIENEIRHIISSENGER